MNQLVTVELGRDIDERVQQILAAVPRLHVRRGRTTRLRVGADTWPLEVNRGITPPAQVTVPALAQHHHLLQSAAGATPALREPGHNQPPTRPPIILIVAERLLPAARQELEGTGLSYVDGSGAVHLQAPGLLIHIEPPLRVRTGSVPEPRGLGVIAVRLIQHLLAAPARDWTVTDLAAAADASMGQTHNVLIRLDAEGFIAHQRAGKAVLRRLTNPTAVLDWLAQVPSARKLPRRLTTHLYAPNPDATLTRLADAAQRASVGWAVTGTAGARAWGAAVATALPVIMVRIDPDHDLPQTAERLGLEPVDGGHNVLLVADVGRLAIQAPARSGSIVVAPKVRVWLDMLAETRGEDAANLFRESVIGY